MSLFTSEQINRYTLQAEQLFTEEYKCIIDRSAIAIVSGISLYTLDDSIIDIRRITYRGKRIDPVNHREFREGFGGFNSTATGTPAMYIYNNLGQSVIKLFPTPSETLSVQQTDLLNPEVIRTQCIVEYYIQANGIEYKLPEYIRRRLLKAYVLKQLFLAEGKGQNLKAYKYWSAKWEYLKELYGIQIWDQLNAPMKLITSGGSSSYNPLARPVLPYSMQGIGVDPGE